MKCLLVQKDITNTDYVTLLRQAAEQEPDIVCFGELSTTGCLYRVQPVESLEHVLHTVSEFPFAVMLGCPVRTDTGMYNVYLFHHRGSCQLYRKIHLFEPMNETTVYQPGTTPGLFETTWGTLGVAICYDIRFPELFTELVQQGATRIFIPAAFPRVRIDDWKRLLVERARENHVTVAGINAVGNDGVNEFGGCTMVVDADGNILTMANETDETMLVVEL